MNYLDTKKISVYQIRYNFEDLDLSHNAPENN